MKHYGDIKSINGSDLAPVDVIIGGSPCQNLSVAGNRQGLSGEQSSLFMEQIRVVKESRKCHGKPRFMLWENAPGAFTSNGGEDFRRVLEETVRIKEESVSIPRPANGKWANAGCIMGDGFSVAWRVHDAQYWGVPQRRRRIALVADFDGQCAGEILFEPKGLRGDSQKSGETRQEATGIVDVCVNTDIERAMNVAGFISGASSDARGIGYESEKSPVLRADAGGNTVPCVVYSFDSLSSNSMKSNNPNSGCRQVEIARTLDTSIPDPSKNQGGVAVVEVYDARGNGNGSIISTITGDHENRITDYTSIICMAIQQGGAEITQNGVCPTITAAAGMSGNNQPVICIGDGQADGLGEHDKVGALNCMHDQQAIVYRASHKYIIRRLTPLECERLQGYTDGWTDIGEWTDAKGKTHKASDAARYKALGNSIALPFWQWLLERFAPYLPKSPTMGSLFDGIGGFPLCWERIYGKGTAVWASEIEPFCIAVTERRFNAR